MIFRNSLVWEGYRLWLLRPKGCWFDPTELHYFSFNNTRLWAYAFTTGDHNQIDKREESNGVHWFETRISTLDPVEDEHNP